MSDLSCLNAQYVGFMILQDTINSASSITQTLSGQLADGQRKLLEMAANSKVAADPFVTQINNGLHEMVCLFVIPFLISDQCF